MKVKEESEKVGLKLNNQKTKIMASSPITWWQIDVKKVETMSDFIFLGSKITVDCDCSHEIKRHLAPWKKSYDKPRQCIKKQRYYFADKGPYSQSYAFPVVMHRCESWTIKTAGAPKNWYFRTVGLGKTRESLELKGNQISQS